jgi:hypothetical protein
MHIMKLLVMQFCIVSSHFLLLGPYILLSTSSGALPVCVRDDVSARIAYKPADKIMVPSILIFAVF